jgi:Leucine-rich repeat (LRR) protein
MNANNIMKLKIFFLMICAALSLGQAHAQIADNVEISALLDFYNATSNNDATPWSTNYSGVNYRWNREKMMTPGVTFDDFTLVHNTFNNTYTTSELRGLILDGNKDVMDITLQPYFKVVGYIPASINNLTALKTFRVQSFTPNSPRNEITGILPNLSGLVNLETLDLYGNDCSGVVDWLGTNGAASNKLKYLNLSSYSFTSATYLIIEPGAGFANLTQLNTLILDYNRFTTASGSVNNLLSPAFQYLDEMYTLTLVSCNLNAASFPPEFGGMAKLATLSLANNTAIQNLPSYIANLTTLTNLNLSSIGLLTLPSNFGSLDLLATLLLPGNGLTNNTNFFNIVGLLSQCAVLSGLNLSNNNLNEVSTNFNQLVALRILDLSLNPIGASDLVNLDGSRVSDLSMQACQLTNKLPMKLLDLTDLATLNLSNIVLGGGATTDPRRNALDLNSAGIEIVLKNLSHLTTLNMHYYAINGPAPLPAWFGSSHMDKIKTLNLSSNKVQLPFPTNFYEMAALETIYIQSNLLEGSLTSDFNCSNFPFLKNVYLGYNKLANPFPDLSDCSFLYDLSVPGNLFAGAVPDYLRTETTRLFLFDIGNNYFDHLPNFKVRPAGSSSMVIFATNNYFDFEDLDHYYTSNCSLQGIAQLGTYAPQRMPQGKKGSPRSFGMPEGLPVTLDFSAPGGNNYYKWEKNGQVLSDYTQDVNLNWLTNNSYYIPNASAANVGVYKVMMRNKCLAGLEFEGADVTFNLVQPLCQSEIPVGSGTFKLDKLTGSIVFERNDCPTKIPLSCVFGPQSTLDNVIAASAVTHSDDWSLAYLGQGSVSNPFTTGERGKWRPKATYTPVSAVNAANDKTYNAGTFRYKPFNWKTSEKSNNPGWLRSSDVLRYSANGDVVEERDVNDIKSTAKFGYQNALPYLIAENAEYASVMFESFENKYSGKFEDGFLENGGASDATTFHSGKNSLKITGASTVTLKTFTVNSQIKMNGVQFKVWVKGTVSNTLFLQLVDAGSIVTATLPAQRLAGSGEWSLYEAVVSPSNFSTFATASTYSLKIQHTGAGVIYVDDVRVQPSNSEMTTYVYDNTTLRLLAVLDDQHFGLFYQYNAEGKLIRKLVETERGVKTLEETQYNSPKVVK